MKLAAAIGFLIVAIILSMNMFLALPLELEGMEYGVSGDELQTLRWKHKEFSDSNFVDFVKDYKKFEHSDVYDFAEARKLEIATYSFFLEHKESMRQLQRDQEKAKLELERRTKEAKLELERQEKEAKLQEERKASEAERRRSSASSATSSSQPSSGTITRIDTSTGNVAISGFSRVTVGKGTSITVNGNRVKNEGDLMVGDRCTVRMESYDLYAQNLVCSR